MRVKKCLNCGKQAKYHIEIECKDRVLSYEEDDYAGFNLCDDCYAPIHAWLQYLDLPLEWLPYSYVSYAEEVNNE